MLKASQHCTQKHVSDFLFLYDKILDLLEHTLLADLITHDTFVKIFEAELFNDEAGALHESEAFNDFLLLDDRYMFDFTSPFFLQWFLAGDQHSPIRFIAASDSTTPSMLYVNIIDILARLDLKRHASDEFYERIWMDTKDRLIREAWPKLMQQNKAVTMNGRDYVTLSTFVRFIALIFVRFLNDIHRNASDFEIAKIMYTLDIFKHPNPSTAPNIKAPPFSIDDVRNEKDAARFISQRGSTSNCHMETSKKGYVYIAYGSTSYVQVASWRGTVSELTKYLEEMNGGGVQTIQWLYQDCEHVMKSFTEHFNAQMVDDGGKLFMREPSPSFEHYLKTFFEPSQASSPTYIVEWLQRTGELIQYEYRSDQLYVDVADMIKVFGRLEGRKAAETFLSQAKIGDASKVPSMVHLHDALEILKHPAVANRFTIPRMMLPFNHNLAAFFVKASPPVVVIQEVPPAADVTPSLKSADASTVVNESNAKRRYPQDLNAEDYLRLRQMELQNERVIKVAECKAREAEARASEAKSILETRRLDAQQLRQCAPALTPSKQTMEPCSKKRKTDVNHPRCTLIKIPKRRAAKIATEHIIQINNQDRKAHTKTSVTAIADAIRQMSTW